MDTVPDDDSNLFADEMTASQNTKKVYLPTKIVKERIKLSQELKARIMEINTIGGVTIQFNRDVKIPTYFNSFNQSIIELKLITQKFNSSLKASRMLSAESGIMQETS